MTAHTTAQTPADRVAEAVTRCPGVAGLSGGVGGGAATYLPGRRITGVVIRDGAVHVHVVGRYGPTMAQITEEVEHAVRSVLPDHRVRVSIDDLDVDPGEPGP